MFHPIQILSRFSPNFIEIKSGYKNMDATLVKGIDIGSSLNQSISIMTNICNLSLKTLQPGNTTNYCYTDPTC